MSAIAGKQHLTAGLGLVSNSSHKIISDLVKGRDLHKIMRKGKKMQWRSYNKTSQQARVIQSV